MVIRILFFDSDLALTKALGNPGGQFKENSRNLNIRFDLNSKSCACKDFEV
jgi:hypothetical protein